jgi:hypothetical protein
MRLDLGPAARACERGERRCAHRADFPILLDGFPAGTTHARFADIHAQPFSFFDGIASARAGRPSLIYSPSPEYPAACGRDEGQGGPPKLFRAIEIQLGCFDQAFAKIAVIGRQQPDHIARLKHIEPTADGFVIDAAFGSQTVGVDELPRAAGTQACKTREDVQVLNLRYLAHIALETKILQGIWEFNSQISWQP